MNFSRITSALVSAVIFISQTDFLPAKAAESEVSFSASCFQSALSDSADESDSLPERYDMREKGLVSSVKDQHPYGTCWAFSSSAALETSLIQKYPFTDLSELHLSYFSFYGDKTPDRPGYDKTALVSGGHIAYAVSSFARWTGPVSEKIMPYDTKEEDIDYSVQNNSEYFISDAYTVNQYSLSKIYPDEQLAFSDTEIKQMILDDNAVSVNIRYENTCNEETFALYDSTKGMTNHAVLLVGWDDSYSSENFLETPPGDGAWLAKNSWGDDWGNNGYFWISYYDMSLSDACCLKAEKQGRYQRNYQHDTLTYSAAVSADSSDRYSGYMANIFTAEDDELISAAALYTTDNNAGYEISVVTGLKNLSDPMSGIQSDITCGTERYAGYHTIELDKAVPVKKGEKFAVVAKLTNPEYFCPIPAEAAVILCENRFSTNVSEISEKKIDECTGAGESFISSNGTKWTDTKDMVIETAYENSAVQDTNIMYYIGNVCLKAFSSSMDSVVFEPDNEQIISGTKVTLSTPSGGTLRYTTDGTDPDNDSPVYSSPLSISEDTTVKAAVFSGENSGRVFSRNYTQAESVLTSLTVNRKPVSISDGNSPLTELYTEINDCIDYAVLFPSGTGRIKINGTDTVSGHESEKIPLNPGENTVHITSVEDGKKETEYTLKIFKSYASVDYYTETIVFDEQFASVYADDGHCFSDGESVSEYLGQTLTVRYGENNYQLDVAARPDLDLLLSRMYTQYGSEALTQIFSVPGDMYFSTSPDMSDAQSINNRLYPVLSDSFFRIYPDYDTDLYFQTAASDTSPKSTVYHISVPSRKVIGDEEVKIEITDDSTVTVTIENAVAERAQYKTEIKNSAENQYSTYLTSMKSFTDDTLVLTDLLPDKTYSLYIQYQSTSDRFSSYIREYILRMPGEHEPCTFNYEKECIIFDDTVYRAFTNDGKEFSCYDNVSEYIGSDIILKTSDNKDLLIHIPERPDPPESSVDFLNGRLTGTFDKSISFMRRKSGSSYVFPALTSSNLTDRDGIIWIDRMYSASYTAGDTLLFFRKATDNSFASDFCQITIPVKDKISKNMMHVLYCTDNSIVLEPHEGLEYGIREDFFDSFKWQDEPVFSELESSTRYILAVRYKASSIKPCSTYTCNIVTTLPGEYISGDLNDDSILSVQDLVILKKIIIKYINPDSQQRRSADVNHDGSVNIIDYLRLQRSLTFL